MDVGGGGVEESAVVLGSSSIRVGPRVGGGGPVLGDEGGVEEEPAGVFSALLSEVVLDLGWFCCLDLDPEE